MLYKLYQWVIYHHPWKKGLGDAVHGCCYEQRKARVLSESWHQLFSIPIAVIPVSSPLLKTSSAFSYTATLSQFLTILVKVITFHNFMKFLIVLGILCSLLCFRCSWRKLRPIRRNRWTVFHINNMFVSIQWLAWRLLIQYKMLGTLQTKIYLHSQLLQFKCFPFTDI